MNVTEIETPKVFISYSWTSPTHEVWVMNLAERLSSNGVEVIIDKWELKEGQDKHAFMESMVTSKDIKKVVMILDKRYSEKADSRDGGVGTEAQIISPHIYENIAQEKFIPIIAEVDADGNPFLPTFLKSRIYIDLSTEEYFEEGFEKLLRNLFNKPIYDKPALGKPPSYLFDENIKVTKVSTLLRIFETKIEKNPSHINSIIRDFLNHFFTNLNDYSLAGLNLNYQEMAKASIDSLNRYLPLRDDFVSFFIKVTNAGIEFDVDILIKFLEKLSFYEKPLDGRSSYTVSEFDNFRFIKYELFLYLIAIGIKQENYKLIEELLYASYLIDDSYGTRNRSINFTKLNSPIDIIDVYYKKNFTKTYPSPVADFLIQRPNKNVDIETLVEADLLCYYVSSIDNDRSKMWFPITYIYKKNANFPLLDKLVSLRHFEKVKGIFDVKNPNEFKIKLTEYLKSDNTSQNITLSHNSKAVKPIYELIEIGMIGSSR